MKMEIVVVECYPVYVLLPNRTGTFDIPAPLRRRYEAAEREREAVQQILAKKVGEQ